MEKVKKIVIFVSGNGSNMSQIISHFEKDKTISVSRVFSNKKHCLGIENAKKAGIDTFTFSRKELGNDEILSILTEINPDLIVLAGFLLKVPNSITSAFENKIINVHPALLPKFGGKGMYGSNVHKAVIETKETKSGITFHYVNENYDEGNIIEQIECEITATDTWENLQQKIQKLEHENFCSVIEKILLN
ncbi:MAG: phosphoribosylglycinamide formyltransferase [Flavobacteriales bacterium]